MPLVHESEWKCMQVLHRGVWTSDVRVISIHCDQRVEREVRAVLRCLYSLPQFHAVVDISLTGIEI